MLTWLQQSKQMGLEILKNQHWHRSFKKICSAALACFLLVPFVAFSSPFFFWTAPDGTIHITSEAPPSGIIPFRSVSESPNPWKQVYLASSLHQADLTETQKTILADKALPAPVERGSSPNLILNSEVSKPTKVATKEQETKTTSEDKTPIGYKAATGKRLHKTFNCSQATIAVYEGDKFQSAPKCETCFGLQRN